MRTLTHKRFVSPLQGAYPPFNGLDNEGRLVGFEIDLARAICQKMQVSCQITTHEWDNIITDLTKGHYDMIMAGMSMIPEREVVVDFSHSYYAYSMAFISTQHKAKNHRTRPTKPV